MKEYRLGDIIDIKHGYAFDGDHIVQTVDFSSLNNGGAIPTLNRNTLSNIAVLEAPQALQQEYVRLAEPYYEAMRKATQQILYLQEARDRLLPKLMSGEIEV